MNRLFIPLPLLLACTACAGGPQVETDARKLSNLADRRIDESSGLACSRRRKGLFWTHNDSGDKPRLYAVNARGRTVATLTVAGAKNRDWEDLCSFTLEDKPRLLVGDIGDNSARRRDCTLYLLGEPRLAGDKLRQGVTVKPLMTLPFRYADGPRDCESLAMDAEARTIYLVSKREHPRKVYALPLPKRPPAGPLTAKPVATLKIPHPTGMDISADGRRAVVVTYTDAWLYRREGGQSWARAFAGRPLRVPLPLRRQGEAVCFGPDGAKLYLTREHARSPLWEVRLKARKEDDR